MIAERWRPLRAVNYDTDREVSDLGNVREADGTPCAQWPTGKGGYSAVSLSRDGARRARLVHVLVMEAFVGPRPEGFQCRHLNGDPTDNRLVNLRWGTASENNMDRVAHGTHNHASKTHCLRGHEFTADNTYVKRNGARQCRRCVRDGENARRRARRMGQAVA